MKIHRFSELYSIANRRGQMSPVAIVFLVLGILFALFVVAGVILALLLFPAVNQARSAAQRTQSRNNLKQIGLAIHNYHDVFNQLPLGATYAVEGHVPHHSWMTRLLPYMEATNIYNQIDLNEPWTASGNSNAFRNVVPAFLHPQQADKARVDSGMGASHYAGNSQVFLENKGLRFYDIIDGTSNTAMAGEVSTGFMAWGDPENRRDLADGFGATPTQFGAPDAGVGGVSILMMDGSVRFVTTDVDGEVLKAIASPAGNEVVNLDF